MRVRVWWVRRERKKNGHERERESDEDGFSWLLKLWMQRDNVGILILFSVFFSGTSKRSFWGFWIYSIFFSHDISVVYVELHCRFYDSIH